MDGLISEKWDDTIYLKKCLVQIDSHFADSDFVKEVSSFKLWVDTKSGEQKLIERYYTLGNYYKSIGLFDSAIMCLRRCLQSSQTAFNIKSQSRCILVLADVYWSVKAYDSSIALVNVLTNGDFPFETKSSALANLANAFQKLGDYKNALIYNNQSYKLLENAIQNKTTNSLDSLQLARQMITICRLNGCCTGTSNDANIPTANG